MAYKETQKLFNSLVTRGGKMKRGRVVFKLGKGKMQYRASIADRVGRNDPCPCRSGLKYKKCCLNKGGAA